ncbi:hypothetical protein D3C87_1521240 [compost metagenome]
MPVHIPDTPFEIPVQTLEAVELIVFQTPVMKPKTLLPAVEMDDTIEFQIETAVFHIEVKIELVDVQSSFHLVETQETTPPMMPVSVAQIAAPEVTKNCPIEVKRFEIQAHATFQTPINQVLIAPQFLKT